MLLEFLAVFRPPFALSPILSGASCPWGLVLRMMRQFRYGVGSFAVVAACYSLASHPLSRLSTHLQGIPLFLRRFPGSSPLPPSSPFSSPFPLPFSPLFLSSCPFPSLFSFLSPSSPLSPSLLPPPSLVPGSAGYLQASGLVPKAAGYLQVRPPVYGRNGATWWNDSAWSSSTLLLFLNDVVDTILYLFLSPFPLHFRSRSHTYPVQSPFSYISSPVPVPIYIQSSPRPHIYPVKSPFLLLPSPSPSPSPAYLFSLVSVPVPVPVPPPTPSRSPCAPPRPPDLVTFSVQSVCTGAGPCERSCWVPASTAPFLQSLVFVCGCTFFTFFTDRASSIIANRQ